MKSSTPKYICRNCRVKTNHQVLHSESVSQSDYDGSFHWFNTYDIVRCLGCEIVSFVHMYGDSDMFHVSDFGEQEYYEIKTMYPRFLKKGKILEHKHLIPHNISTIYDETVKCIENDCKILAAGGLRAITVSYTHLTLPTTPYV